MFLLNKGVNQIYATVSDMNTINNAIYTLIITDETTKEVKNITVLDTSLYAIRYNQFQVTVVDDILNEDLPNGIVYLNEGKHTYTITASSVSPPLTITCEYGIVKVLKFTPAPGESYTDTMTPITYTSYTGNISQSI